MGNGQAWQISDACDYLHISKGTMYALLKAKRVRSINVGRRRFLPDDEVQRIARDGVGSTPATAQETAQAVA